MEHNINVGGKLFCIEDGAVKKIPFLSKLLLSKENTIILNNVKYTFLDFDYDNFSKILNSVKENKLNSLALNNNLIADLIYLELLPKEKKPEIKLSVSLTPCKNISTVRCNDIIFQTCALEMLSKTAINIIDDISPEDFRQILYLFRYGELYEKKQSIIDYLQRHKIVYKSHDILDLFFGPSIQNKTPYIIECSTAPESNYLITTAMIKKSDSVSYCKKILLGDLKLNEKTELFFSTEKNSLIYGMDYFVFYLELKSGSKLSYNLIDKIELFNRETSTSISGRYLKIMAKYLNGGQVLEEEVQYLDRCIYRYRVRVNTLLFRVIDEQAFIKISLNNIFNAIIKNNECQIVSSYLMCHYIFSLPKEKQFDSIKGIMSEISKTVDLNSNNKLQQVEFVLDTDVNSFFICTKIHIVSIEIYTDENKLWAEIDRDMLVYHIPEVCLKKTMKQGDYYFSFENHSVKITKLVIKYIDKLLENAEPKENIYLYIDNVVL